MLPGHFVLWRRPQYRLADGPIANWGFQHTHTQCVPPSARAAHTHTNTRTNTKPVFLVRMRRIRARRDCVCSQHIIYVHSNLSIGHTNTHRLERLTKQLTHTMVSGWTRVLPPEHTSLFLLARLAKVHHLFIFVKYAHRHLSVAIIKASPMVTVAHVRCVYGLMYFYSLIRP